ncbi:MAG: phosphoglucosamine mutase [Actinomycetota bacterium]
MKVKFGTDGVRGIIGKELFADTYFALGQAAARVLPGARWAVGRDTRPSGLVMEGAFVAGLVAQRAGVVDLGILPTPAVAWIAWKNGMAAGVITASHNPAEHNGLKLFTPAGSKFDPAQQAAIEDALSGGLGAVVAQSPTAEPILGMVYDGVQLCAGYLDWLAGTHPGVGEGLHIGLDCASGAAGATVPGVFQRLGARTSIVYDDLRGEMINHHRGATHPALLQDLVRSGGLDVGFAFDGDADRLIAVDERAEVVDGDAMIALIAGSYQERGLLTGDVVVVTEWSNPGLFRSLRERGIEVVVTSVGDISVVRELRRTGGAIGGEQSGHLVFPGLSPTGDGLLSALQVLDVMRRTGRPLSELAAAAFRPMPQVSRKVPVAVPPAQVVAGLNGRAAERSRQLGPDGRVVLRASGTESVVWVLVEAEDDATARQTLEAFATLVAESSPVAETAGP